MSFAAILTLCLCTQVTYSPEDSINQWENHLLEAKWALVDEVTGAPRLLLVMRCMRPDHRIFELYMYDWWDGTTVRTVDAWTGSYKMEARENRKTKLPEKFVRLEFEQHWSPVDVGKQQWLERWMTTQGYRRWIAEGDAAHWTEALSMLDWTEEIDFKPFFVQFKIDPAPNTVVGPRSIESIKFRMMSDDVKKVGWWKLDDEFVLSPVKKWRRAPRWITGGPETYMNFPTY